MKISDHAKGRWSEIVTALVGEDYANARKHQPCPSGGGTDRYRFSDKTGSGNFFCGCSQGEKDGFELLMCCKGLSFAEAARAVESVIGPCPPETETAPVKRSGVNDHIRSIAKPSHRSRYLESRGLEMAPGLLFVDRLDYFDENRVKVGTFAAMIGQVKRGSEVLTHHVTYLDRGGKASVNPARKLMPGPSLQGASVQLYPAESEMAVAEGIETAIAGRMLFQIPVWSCLNTSLMKTWEPPAIAKRVVILADNDAHFAGHSAAYTLAHRLSRKGIVVSVKFPKEHKDWNDHLLAQRISA